MDAKAFWGRVKVLIKAHKITQVKFADHIGLSPGTLRTWIHFNRIPDVGTAFDMAAALGVSPHYLVYGKENDTTEAEKKRRTEAKKAVARALALNEQMRNDLKLIKRFF